MKISRHKVRGHVSSFLPFGRNQKKYVIKYYEKLLLFQESAQDQEFIYPYYRLLEEGIEDVCMLEGKLRRFFRNHFST